MGLPTFGNAPAAAAAVERPRSLFVSYSHLDAEAARAFYRHLCLLVRGTPALRLAESSVFFDRQQLRAGEDWSETIDAALERADLLVFLVSVNSLNSTFCCERELAVAAARGIPIVPIVLSECTWEDIVVPRDPRARPLGRFGALPKDEGFNLREVSRWPQADAAWTCVMRSLKERLHPQAAPVDSLPAVAGGTTAAATGGPRHVPRLLPYLCNQDSIAGRFDLALDGRAQRRDRALVVLVKGTQDDEPPMFWERLHVEHLAKIAEAGGQRCLENAPLFWPPVQASLRSAEEVAGVVRLQLSRAITGNQFVVKTPSCLAREVGALGGVRPLVATFPKEPAKALKAALHALLDFIEGCPAEADLSRLVLAILVVDDAELLRGELVRSWKLAGYQRSQVVELAPLAELTPDDVAQWHQDQRVADQWGLSRAGALGVFGNAARLRMAPFVERIRPLLAGTG